jgi:DNA phosphorothioation-dependent restriction protein DptF
MTVIHPLINELQKLRESSKYAVAHGSHNNLDDFKKYLHIERDVESVLKNAVINCSKNNKAQLLLVCGNVGDGKSHILSHLYSELYSEISQFKIHNDATESHNPNESSNDTLYKLLDGFKDENINHSTDKIILAINLGTLSKFLEIFKTEFSQLSSYVIEQKILDTDIVHNDGFNQASYFHHVNFTDYHMYALSENGAVSEIISNLLQKIISNDSRNPIYKAYLDFKKEYKNPEKCPIVYNYEFLFDVKMREVLIQLIIKAIVKSKEIISLRSLLNFIYDILVPIDLSSINPSEYIKKIESMNDIEFVSNIIPNYLFDHSELSSLFEKISALDPCNYRDSKIDDILLKLINSESPIEIFESNISTIALTSIHERIKSKKVQKENLSTLFIRLYYFSNYDESIKNVDSDYNEYMELLFHYNNNNPIYLKKIYRLVENAIRSWNGDPKTIEKVIINVGKRQTRYRVFKDFEVHPEVGSLMQKQDKIINKFVQEFTLNFKINNDTETLKIHVDYSLFKILKTILLGYRPNKKDNNNYVYFVNLINKLINQNNDKAALYIDEVNIGKAVDYKFSKDVAFNTYKFELV